MSWWQRLYGASTRGRIITLLRRRRRSVDELAEELELTDNAVRAHLGALESDGVVVAAGVRRDGTVGKPATIYDIAPTAQPMFSGAYAPVLAALLAELGDRLSPRELESVLRDTGRRIAEGMPEPRGDLGRRVREAAAFLDQLGGLTEVEKRGGRYVVQGASCPLAEAVSVNPGVCRAVETALAEATGVPVRERCDRSAGSRCRFEFGGDER